MMNTWDLENEVEEKFSTFRNRFNKECLLRNRYNKECLKNVSNNKFGIRKKLLKLKEQFGKICFFLYWLEVSIYKAFIKRLWICLRIMPCFVMLLFHVFVAFVVDVCYMFNIWQRLASVSWICLGGCVNIFFCPLFVIACSERDVELINNALCKVSQLTTSKLTLTLWRQYNDVLSQAVV